MKGEITVHHYVPRAYLEGFTAPPGTRQLYVYQKGSQEVVRTTPDRVGYEKRFYSFTRDDGTRDSSSVEIYLRDMIDGPGNAVLQKIRARQAITDEERTVFSEYLAAMLKRVPRHRAKILEIFPEVRSRLATQLETEFRDAALATPERAALIEQRSREAQAILEEYAISPPDHIIVQQINTSLAPYLRQMTWQFLIAVGGRGFLTCDSPLYYHEGPGLAHQRAEVTFPIDTHMALWATWRADLQEGYILTTPEAVDEINQRTASIAMRWMFHANKRRWIRTLVNRSSYQLTWMT